MLGICLGAQMMASTLGARVFNYEDSRSEIGYFPIEPSEAADALCGAPFPRCVYQWHSDGFDLPKGAELLATGAAEFPQSGLSLWQARDRPAVPPRSHLPHDVPMDVTRRRTHDPPRRAGRLRHLGGWFQHDGRVAAWLDAFLPAWLEGRLPEIEKPKGAGAANHNRAPTPPQLAAVTRGLSLVPVHKRQVVEIIYGIVVLTSARPGGFG